MEPRYINEAVIESGKIYERRFGRDPLLIGVAIEAHEQLERDYEGMAQAHAEKQQMLIDLGKEHGKEYIKIPLTPEEQLQKQAAQIDALIELAEKQAAQISALTEKRNEYIQRPSDVCEDSGPTRSRRDNRKNRKQFRQMG